LLYFNKNDIYQNKEAKNDIYITS